jgi:hypothetical protein
MKFDHISIFNKNLELRIKELIKIFTELNLRKKISQFII